GSKQRLETVEDAGDRMRLERQEDIILRAKPAGIAGGRDLDGGRARFALQAKAALAHRRKMGPSRDEADLGIALDGKPRADQSADGARTEDADLHQERPSLAARPMGCRLPVAHLGRVSRTISRSWALQCEW